MMIRYHLIHNDVMFKVANDYKVVWLKNNLDLYLKNYFL